MNMKNVIHYAIEIMKNIDRSACLGQLRLELSDRGTLSLASHLMSHLASRLG